MSGSSNDSSGSSNARYTTAALTDMRQADHIAQAQLHLEDQLIDEDIAVINRSMVRLGLQPIQTSPQTSLDQSVELDLSALARSLSISDDTPPSTSEIRNQQSDLDRRLAWYHDADNNSDSNASSASLHLSHYDNTELPQQDSILARVDGLPLSFFF
jgi:hypothetical protein